MNAQAIDIALTAPTDAPAPHTTLARHPGFQRLFQPGALTVGLILPLETHPGRPAPTMAGHVEMAQRAETLGFGALWMRDIPFYDPHYGDVAQIFEPMVYMSHLAAVTSRIVVGTTGIVLPTREPMNLAKQAASLDYLSGGRLVLGLSSGDRLSDYPCLVSTSPHEAIVTERHTRCFEH
jgi:luciferase-type oxidoreductase